MKRLGPTLVTITLALTTGCGRPPPASHSAPAKVEKLPQETEIARITLSPEAEQRLGITLAEVQRGNVERRRTLAGEVLIPAGQAWTVSAPLPGTITTAAGNTIPLPGQSINAGDVVLSLVPLLSPERDVPTPAERVQIANSRATLLAAETVAKGDVERSRAEVENAKIAVDRATKLFEDKAGSARAVDDAQAQLNIATAMLQAAQERAQQLASLARSLDGSGAGEVTPLVLRAPQAGLIRNLAVSPGQTVAAGALLFEVVKIDAMWIRVPVYVDLLAELDSDSSVAIVGLDGRPKVPPRTAQPVAAPPSADPLNATSDLFFATDNRDGQLRPGQRVGVELLLRGEQAGAFVPAKAILYDIYGGTWVYVQVGEHVFQRARVAVRFTADERAVLATGPPEGVKVVVDGAAELFGTEFGAGK